MGKRVKDTDYIYLHTGERLLPEEITAEHISIDHITRGLANIKRFNGQTDVSVLRHSIGVALHFPAGSSERRVGLFHDAAEAYLLDVPVPLKRFTNGAWAKRYDAIERAVCKAFDLPAPNSRVWKRVKKVDKAVVPYEMTIGQMMGHGEMEFPGGYKARLKDHMAMHKKYAWFLRDEHLHYYFEQLLREEQNHTIHMTLQATLPSSYGMLNRNKTIPIIAHLEEHKKALAQDSSLDSATPSRIAPQSQRSCVC